MVPKMAGCLLPFILLIAGGLVGALFGGQTDAYLGAAIGLLAGVVAMVALIAIVALAKQR
jgi:hypothetical protein